MFHRPQMNSKNWLSDHINHIRRNWCNRSYQRKKESCYYTIYVRTTWSQCSGASTKISLVLVILFIRIYLFFSIWKRSWCQKPKNILKFHAISKLWERLRSDNEPEKPSNDLSWRFYFAILVRPAFKCDIIQSKWRNYKELFKKEIVFHFVNELGCWGY